MNKESRHDWIAEKLVLPLADIWPCHMKRISHKNQDLAPSPFNLKVNNFQLDQLWNNGFRNLGTHIWNSLLDLDKAEADYSKSEEYIDTWYNQTVHVSSNRVLFLWLFIYFIEFIFF